MAKKDNTKKPNNAKSTSAPQSVDLSVGGNMEKSVVVIGDNNIVNYYEIVSTNTEKHEPDYWNLKHPYPMPPNFTGRVAERAMLTQWLNDDSENRLFILRALGGFGKSALTWHWLTHDIDPKAWTKLVFWSFYEGDASFEYFIEETLKYLKLEIPQGQRPQVDELLKAMQSQKILLIMDGFERVLRLYANLNAAYQEDEELQVEDNQLDCVNINAEWFLKGVCANKNIKSKVLMTTRHAPRVVKPRGEFMLGCREEELAALQKADAVEFFHKQKIKGSHAEIEAACAPYGYHPLSLRLLARLILKDFENPADIIVTQKLKIVGDIKQYKHHVLEVSYNSLSPQQQYLISVISSFRSSVSTKVLVEIVKTKKNITFDVDVQNLIDCGLLGFDSKTTRFDMHPIVRLFVYGRINSEFKKMIHTMLTKYFAQKIPTEKPKDINDLMPIIELYFHTVRAGVYEDALSLLSSYLVPTPLVHQFGAHQLIIELLNEFFLVNDSTSLVFSDYNKKTWIYNALANSYSSTGQSRRALQLFLAGKELDEIIGDKDELAAGLINLAGDVQLYIGHLKDAEYNLRRCVELSELAGNKSREAKSHLELGLALSYIGDWEDAEKEIITALRMSILMEDSQQEGVNYNYRALWLLLLNRHLGQSGNQVMLLEELLKHAKQGLLIAESVANMSYPVEQDFIRSHHLLGSTYRLHKSFELSDQHLRQALTRCRTINFVVDEANILLDLARLRYAQNDFKDAQEKASEALTITERSGYVLQGADVNLFLAQYALEQEKDKVKAKEYAESALKLATCDGPPYYYKVAYEEAERMLEKLK